MWKVTFLFHSKNFIAIQSILKRISSYIFLNVFVFQKINLGRFHELGCQTPEANRWKSGSEGTLEPHTMTLGDPEDSQPTQEDDGIPENRSIKPLLWLGPLTLVYWRLWTRFYELENERTDNRLLESGDSLGRHQGLSYISFDGFWLPESFVTLSKERISGETAEFPPNPCSAEPSSWFLRACNRKNKNITI